MQSGVTALVAALLWLPSVGSADAVVSQTVGDGGKTSVVMENEFVRLSIDPSRGARVSSFVYKPGGEVDWIGKAPTMGMFLDHVWQQTWPGVLLEAKYDCEIVSAGPERAEVKVWKRIDSGEGKDTVWGVMYERSLTLKRNNPAIHCTIRLTNTSTEPRSPGLWLQHVFSAGGPTAENVYFRPSVKGIDSGFNRYVGKELAVEKKGNEWVKEPAAAWSAAVDPASKVGMAMLVDYNYLRWWYNCLGGWTMEVMYDQVQLPPGKMWQTEVTVVPVGGFDGLAHASAKLLADLRGEISGSELRLASAVAAVEEMRGVKLSLTAETVASRATVGSLDFDLGGLTRTPVGQTLTFPVTEAARREGVVVRAELRAEDGVVEVYETLIAAPRNKGTPPLAVGYARPKPPKRKQYFKPDPLILTPHKGFNVLECRGMWFREWQVERAASLIADAAVTPSYHQINVYGDRLTYFPPDYDALMQLDVIVLSNVTADALSDAGLEKVKDFVEAGGGLLVLGGRFAFAAGSYKGTQLEGLLPVGIGDPFSVRPAKRPLRLQSVRDNPITTGLDWESSPAVSFPQTVGPVLSDANVLVTADKQPFLVTRRVGKGRVAVIPASVEGRAGRGGPLFHQWRDWPKLMANVLTWLRGDR